MHPIRHFENSEISSKIRTVIVDHEPWFVAKDVCSALDLKNSRQVIAELEDDEKQIFSNSNVHSTDIKIPNRGLQCVSESGLYLLIFKSRKPEAKTFCKWVTKIVLPAIRKTGSYGTKPTVPQVFFYLVDGMEQRKIHVRKAAIIASKLIINCDCVLSEEGLTKEECLEIFEGLAMRGLDKINSKNMETRLIRNVRIAQHKRAEGNAALPLRNGHSNNGISPGSLSNPVTADAITCICSQSE